MSNTKKINILHEKKIETPTLHILVNLVKEVEELAISGEAFKEELEKVGNKVFVVSFILCGVFLA